MQLEKITKQRQSEEKRRFDDACGLAHAMELLGERWAMLVLRELAYGPRRFSELKADLQGISANVLTQRLTELEARGLVRKTKLPPPASVQVYEATEWGLEAIPVIASLGRGRRAVRCMTRPADEPCFGHHVAADPDLAGARRGSRRPDRLPLRRRELCRRRSMTAARRRAAASSTLRRDVHRFAERHRRRNPRRRAVRHDPGRRRHRAGEALQTLFPLPDKVAVG